MKTETAFFQSFCAGPASENWQILGVERHKTLCLLVAEEL